MMREGDDYAKSTVSPCMRNYQYLQWAVVHFGLLQVSVDQGISN